VGVWKIRDIIQDPVGGDGNIAFDSLFYSCWERR